MTRTGFDRPRWRATAIALGVLGTLASGAPRAQSAGASGPDADAPAVDTSAWKCAQCPYFTGIEGEAELGGEYAHGANAKYGQYTGIDHSGGYVDADADAHLRNAEGSYADVEAQRLGLPARDASIDGGQEGRFELRIRYDGQPDRQYDSAITPFQGGNGTLRLPSGWVPGATTAGMSALGASLAPVDIETERRTVSLLGQYLVTPQWTLFSQFERQEREGTGLTSASFLTEAVQLPRYIDYVTDSIEAGAAWSGHAAGLRLTYTGSWFEDDSNALLFANPYVPLVGGSTEGRLGTPPGNNLQQLAANGNVLVPWRSTALTYAVSLGSLRQNAAFLPVSTLPGAPALPAGALDGNVLLSHYALGLSSRPWSRLSLRGNATYDGRDDHSTPIPVAYTVTDTYPGGTALAPRYGQNKLRLDAGADYSLVRWARVGIGGEYVDMRYGSGQFPTHTAEARSWARATVLPLPQMSITLKFGDALRKASGYDLAALPAGENALVRPYDSAPRDRLFATLTASWSPIPSLAWTLEAYLANDDYRSSPLGLQSVHERRTSTMLSWTPADTLSAHLDAGYQTRYALQNGSNGSPNDEWLLTDTQRFWNLGAGGRWVPQERWTLLLDYRFAPSFAANDAAVGGLAQGFPQNTTRLNTMDLNLSYRCSAAMQLRLRVAHESFSSSDWALSGVAPASVPDLLSLGLQPYRENVNLIGVTLRYAFRKTSP
jgi:MtrB/PioB family decaheme-associated outer membrane protein